MRNVAKNQFQKPMNFSRSVTSPFQGIEEVSHSIEAKEKSEEIGQIFDEINYVKASILKMIENYLTEDIL